MGDVFRIDRGGQRALGAASDILSAFDAGGGRTPLMIIGVDYRNSDFGVYPEFVVALTVTAKGDPAGQLFAYYLAIVVTQEFTKEAARVVWGLEKIVWPKLAVSYAPDAVRFGLPNGSGNALSIRFPRFGDGASSDQPTFSLSQRGEGANTANLLGDDDEKRQRRGNPDRRLGGAGIGRSRKTVCVCAATASPLVCATRCAVSTSPIDCRPPTAGPSGRPLCSVRRDYWTCPDAVKRSRRQPLGNIRENCERTIESITETAFAARAAGRSAIASIAGRIAG